MKASDDSRPWCVSRALPQQHPEIRGILLTARDGEQIPLESLARISTDRGRLPDQARDGKRRIVIGDQRAGSRSRRVCGGIAAEGRKAGDAAGGILLRVGRPVSEHGARAAGT